MIEIIKAVGLLNWYHEQGISYYFKEHVEDTNISKNVTANINITPKTNENVIKNFNPTSKTNNYFSDPSSSYSSSDYAKKSISKDSLKAAKMARDLADKATNLEELRHAVMNFDLCDLKKGAKNTVFADGAPSAKIMLLGEAPGATEDEKSIPFCGESGMLLDEMLASIGLSRKENVYISNTVFWRPPANRAPTKEEISICKPFVEKHISLINPSAIILVGGTAAKSLLGDHVQISKIRKEYYQYKNQYLKNSIVITGIFHPAYLLRSPLNKKDSWFDLLKIKQKFLDA